MSSAASSTLSIYCTWPRKKFHDVSGIRDYRDRCRAHHDRPARFAHRLRLNLLKGPPAREPSGRLCVGPADKLRGVHDGAKPTADLTGLLQAWDRGDAAALEQLAPLLETELRVMARRILAGEQRANGWQPTELVHEAYLRLLGWQKSVRWQNRAHFFSTTAAMMRRVLVDAARVRNAAKRDGGMKAVSLDGFEVAAPGAAVDVVAIADALTALADVAPRASQVVELRFFGGFSVEETAETLGVSARTVNSDWNTARAWLSRELVKRYQHGQ